jgi:hypothetical protein
VFELKEIEELFLEINKVQEGQDLSCTCTDCYWNMFHPSSKFFDKDASKICVSESLTEFKMTPNTEQCNGFYSYTEACGHPKGE